MELPKKTRVYSSEHFNSERWNDVVYRDDDIIVSTAMRSGTTWMLRIVGLMVFKDPGKVDGEVMHAPWPDAVFADPPEAAVEEAEGIAHRRRGGWKSVVAARKKSGGTHRLHAVSQRAVGMATAQLCGTVVQCNAMDGNAARRSFCCNGRTGFAHQ